MQVPQSHYLYPSTMFASRQATLVSTILGSCVAVCLWDRKLGFGGINHYMMPLWNGEGLPSPKYGNVANEKLIDRMVNLGSDPKNLDAKIFGGGDILMTNNDQFHVGIRNINIAIEMMREANIPIIGKSVGGTSGRKILFNTQTGMVRQVLKQKIKCNV